MCRASDGDGDDDGDDDGPDHVHIGTPEFGKSRELAHQYEFGKLFDAKDAKPLPGINGKDKAGLWREKVFCRPDN